MAKQIKMPKFGEWDSEQNYTGFFDQARSKRDSVKMNPKGQQNHSLYSDNVSTVQATPSQMETKLGAQKEQQPVRTKHMQSMNPEDNDLRRSSDSPQCQDTANPKVSGDLPVRRQGSTNSSDSTKRGVKQNMGPDHRIEYLPLHPQQQPKVGGKGSEVFSHPRERKGFTERNNNLAPVTPGRCRLRSVTQGGETRDPGSTVPKFGDWDESDPKAADEFTHDFNKVREEKLNGKPNIASVKAFQNPYAKGQKQHDNEMSKKCCCFPW